MKKVAIQGVKGCYHEMAAREYFNNEEIEIVPCVSFAEMFEQFKKDPSLLGIMAIENTIAGSLLQNHELLRQSNMRIIGEHKLHISHTLSALPGEKLEDIKEVNSHPIALMQCMEYLEKRPDIKIVEKGDTASSAADISRLNLSGHAAICSEYASKIYGLNILAKAIETNKRNFTRFLTLADQWSSDDYIDKSNINKSSLVFCVPHTHGSLSKVLTIFSFYDLNLTKIQSMPILGREWEYRFYIDLTFDDYIRYKQALEAIMPFTKDFKILGEYENATIE
ncbi:MAG: prephenate dehydratase [Bacteroidales bacterium]|nr:prephenate dehydratase [Bacteroidales bacterium]